MKRIFKISLIGLISMLTLPSFAQTIKFNHTYGSKPYNYGKKIIQANDKGYFILANENGQVANTNIHIIRTDSLGIILWEKTIGNSSIYSANDFIRTDDKGFLITGLTDKNPSKGYDVLLVKTDSMANVLWEKSYGGSDWDIGNSVVETMDSAYLIAGQTFSYPSGQENIYILKTNFAGDTIWTKVFGGDSTDYATSADILFDSTYLIGATTNSFGHGNYDGYVLNLNKKGDTIWTKTYGEDKEDILYSIKHCPDSGFVFVGSTMSYNAIQHENWLMKFDKNRNLIWKMPEFWDIGAGDDISYNVNVDDSGRYVITGFTDGAGNGGKDLSVTIMSDVHIFICSHTDGSTNDDIGSYGIPDLSGGYTIIGTSNGLGNCITNIYFVRMAQDCSYNPTTQPITPVEEFQSNSKEVFCGIYPSISDGKFNAKLNDNSLNGNYHIMVTDLMGKIVFSEVANHLNSQPFLIDISDKAAGVYFITISDNEHYSAFKVVKYNN